MKKLLITGFCLILCIGLMGCSAHREASVSSGRLSSHNGNRADPIPISQTAAFDGMHTTYDRFKIELTMTQVIRGADALAAVKEANRMNKDPAKGKEYILMQFHVKVLKSADQTPVQLNNAMFKLVSRNGVTYDTVPAVAGLTPAFSALYLGEEGDGMVYGSIDEGDMPTVVFLSRHDNGTWFRIQ